MLYSLAALLPLALQATHIPLAPEGMDSFSAFGVGLDLCGDTAIAGAHNGGSPNFDEGFAQFYERDPASGEWSSGLRLDGDNFERYKSLWSILMMIE